MPWLNKETIEMVKLGQLLDVNGKSYYTGSGFNFRAGYLFNNN